MTQGSDKIALEVDEFSLYGGGKVAFQDVYLTGAKYSGSNVGNDIAITGGTVQYSTLSEQSSDDFSKDFVITAPSDITGSITPKIIEEGDIVVNGLSVTKSYDSSKAPGDATFSGKAYVNGTSNKVEVTGEVTVFVASNVGDRTATVLFNLLSGEGSGNYALKDGAVSKSGISAKITKAAMTYPHTKKNFKVREGQAFFTPDAEILEYFSNNHARGVSNGSGGYEEVSVTPSYFKDPSCSHLLTEDDQRALAPGQTHTVYVKLTPVPQFNENYKDFILPYPIQVTVQPLPQQNLVWDQPIALDNGVYRVKYGDSNIDFRVVNNTSGGGDITYESSEMNIATVNPNTGAITAKNVGRTTVTATAARVDGKYGKTSISYTLEVTKKPVNVKINDRTDLVYNETIPDMNANQNAYYVLGDNEETGSSHSGLVAGDTKDAVQMKLSTNASKGSDAGEYPINGIFISSDKYEVKKVIPGKLTIAKGSSDEMGSIVASIKVLKDSVQDVEYDVQDFFGVYQVESIESNGEPTNDEGVIDGNISISGKNFKFRTKSVSTGTATIPLKAKFKNYEDKEFTVTVTVADKKTPYITGIEIASHKEYDGKPMTYTGTATVDGQVVQGATYEWYSGEYTKLTEAPVKPVNTAYSLTVTIPATENYERTVRKYRFTISPRQMEIIPNHASMTEGASLPTLTFAFGRLVENERIDLSGNTGGTYSPVFEILTQDGRVATTPLRAGEYKITLKNASALSTYLNKNAALANNGNYAYD